VVSFDGSDARDYLGHEWSGSRAGGRGRLLPASGARIFLPPLGGRSRRLEIFVGAASESAASIEVFAEGQRLPQLDGEPGTTSATSQAAASTMLQVAAGAARSLTIELSVGDVGSEVVELFLRPAVEDGAVRILGFRLE
jgi:hypothetical protein